MAQNPNAKEKLNPLNPVPRYLDPSDLNEGLSNPGYTCISRRPRVPGITDILPDADADTLEQMFGDMPKYD